MKSHVLYLIILLTIPSSSAFFGSDDMSTVVSNGTGTTIIQNNYTNITNITNNTFTSGINISEGKGIILTPNPITENGTIAVNTADCNPANQASSFNGTGFECVSNIDNDSAYIPWTSESILDVNSSQYWGGFLYPLLLGNSGQILSSLGNGSTLWIDIPPSSSALLYILHNDTESEVSYSSKNMNLTRYVNSPVSYLNYSSLPNGDTLLTNWTSPSMNFSFIPQGVHTFHIHALKVGGVSKTVKLFFECGIVTFDGGNQSIRGSSELSTEILTDDTDVSISMIMPDQHLNLTDRMIIRVWANQIGGGASSDLQLLFDDLTDSRLTFPVIATDLTSTINSLQSDVLQLQQNDTTGGYVTNLTVDKNLSNYTFPQNILYGKPAFAWTNGSNNLAINTILDYQMGYNGTYQKLELKSQQSGSINITVYNATDNAYICSAAIVAGTSAITTCTPYNFVLDQWIYYKIISVTGIRDVTVSPRVIRT